MTIKNVLLALAATSLFAFGSVAPVYAQEEQPAAEEGESMDMPADDSADSGDAGDTMADPGMEEGAGDAGMEGGEQQPE